MEQIIYLVLCYIEEFQALSEVCFKFRIPCLVNLLSSPLHYLLFNRVLLFTSTGCDEEFVEAPFKGVFA